MRQAIILDFDDTLVETNILFELAKQDFIKWMEELGFDAAGLPDKIDAYDIAHVKRLGGFMMECFPLALGDSYAYLCAAHGRPVCELTRQRAQDLGWAVFDAKPRVKDGVRETLATLSRDYPLLLATQGNYESQLQRVQASGLAEYFQKTYIVSEKSVKLYKQIIEEWRLAPARSFMIGNSIRSDINPAVEAGLQAIFIPGDTWHFEQGEPTVRYHEAAGIREVPALVARILSSF